MSIKVIAEPGVYLVGRPELADGLPDFLDDHDISGWTTDAESHADAIPEIGGRLCYMSFARPRPGGNAAYLKHILEVGHGSVIEHAVFTFIFTGVSRSLTHELVRHRAGMSYSQLSQRYVDESDVAFVVPPAYIGMVGSAVETMRDLGLVSALEFGHAIANKSMPEPETEVQNGLAWLLFVESARSIYANLVADLEDPTISDKTARRKQAREAARSVLPNCTETKIVVTGNCRAWRHFLEMRGSTHADAEIRRLALAVLPVLNIESPAIFGDYVVETTDGVDHITTPYRKV